MKYSIFSLFSIFFFLGGYSQEFSGDSLSGFDISQVVMDAHSKNYFEAETKVFLKQAKRNYLINKYGLLIQKSPPIISAKYSSAQISNLPCLNEGFESVPTGSLPMSSSGWTVTEALNNSGTTILCSSNVAFTTPTVNNNALVVATPYADANCNNVPNSPLGGSQVIQLNKNNQNTVKMTKISQTFNVTPSNWFYKYAYKGVFYSATHGCCDDPVLMIRFFDCNNTLISAFSHSVVPEDETCVTNTFSCGVKSPWPWVGGVTSSSIRYTPNWVVEGVNLSQYIGSCVTVEVIAANCTGAAHQGYCYFDSECASTGGIAVNGFLQSSLSYTSCAPTATLTGLPCFTNYLWQGPSTSSVSGSTNSVISSNVPGTYTLVSSTGSLSSTQIINVSFVSSLPTVSISTIAQGSCLGSSYTLIAVGSGINSYLWNTLATTSSITIPSLNSTTVYTVTVTDANGCTAIDTKTITVQPTSNPVVQIVPSNSILCLGQTNIITASTNGVSSYTWSNGANTPTIAISPTTSTANYSVTVTNSLGCTNTAFANFTVQSAAAIALTAKPSTAICAGEKVILNAFGNGLVNFMWSTGSNVAAMQVSPSVSTVYTVTATDSTNMCQSQTTKSITVLPCVGFIEDTIKNENSLDVFPNPASDVFTIKGYTETTIQIVNDHGQIVNELLLSVNNNYIQIIEGLPKGIYIVRSEKVSVKLLVE